MLSNFSDYFGSDVLEAGCGMGNLAEYLIDRRKLTVVDIDQRHMNTVARRFGHLENVSVRQGDLEEPSFYESLEAVDSVLCVNVLEHLDKPEVALEGFHQVLREQGHALILVPAHDWLFSAADEALGHRTRYEVKQLIGLTEAAGFEVIESGQFNRLGVLGWYVNKLTGRTTIGKWQATMFGLLLPIAKLVENFKFLPGLSVIAVARKS
jgi:SAM-dependent methyltransferase